MDKKELILLQQWLEDESFENWVKLINKKDIAKWEEYFNAHPEYWETAKKGKLLISGIQFQEIESASNEGQRSLSNLLEKIEAKKATTINSDVEKVVQNTEVLNWRRRWFAAASIAAVMLISCVMYFQLIQPTEIIIATGYGEQDEINLPDGSVVTLNANSRLIYNSKFSRIVQLEGEAFFEIKKKPKTGKIFQVMTPDLLVSVLGTSFNVNARNDQTKVFLEEGKVELELENSKEEFIEMVPGDELTYSKKNNILTEKRKNVSVLENTSWKEGSLIFNKTPLSQALYDIEDIYGIHFILESDEMKQEEMTGGIPIKDLNVTLETLNQVYGLSIREEGKRYFLSKKEG